MNKLVVVCFFLVLICIPCLPREKGDTIETENKITGSSFRISLPDLEEGHYLLPVSTFLERYLDKLVVLKSKKEQLQMLKTNRIELRMNDIPFENRSESLQFILQMITPDLPLVIQDQERKIRVFWLVNDENEKIELVFPKQYDLILGKDKKELTDSFQQELENFRYTYTKQDDDFSFEPSKTLNNVYADLGEIYLIPQMKSGKYVQMKSGRFEYLLNERMGEESLLNLFSHADRMNRKNKLDIALSGYDKKFRFDYTLDRLCAFMKTRNCKAFLGIETADSVYTGTVLYVNQLLGYKHLLHFRFPNTAFFRENDVIHVKLYAYIPISNIENLYDEGDRK